MGEQEVMMTTTTMTFLFPLNEFLKERDNMVENKVPIPAHRNNTMTRDELLYEFFLLVFLINKNQYPLYTTLTLHRCSTQAVSFVGIFL